MVQVIEPLTEEQIAALPVYEWDVARIGDAASPLTYHVTEQSIADYCAAVRNMNPLYLDPLAAADGPFRGLIAPPTFAFKCAPLRRNEVMHARGFASPEEKGIRATPYAKAELFFGSPIRPGETITSTVELEEMYERRGNQFMSWRTRGMNERGDTVVEYTYTIIWQQAPRAEPRAVRAAPDDVNRVAPIDPLPTTTKLESQEAIDRYAELTRVRPRVGSNLHTDASFAQRTIFGGTVNMGPASAAYCSEVMELAFGPQALLRPGARLEFKGIQPIRAGDEIRISGRIVARADPRVECELTIRNQIGALVGVGSATAIVGE